jgi:hypothetical protein
MLRSTGYQHQIAFRLLDYTDPHAPWQRGLWALGTLLSLKEVLEAAQARNVSVLSAGSLEHICNATSDIAIRDPGLGSLADRKLIHNCLRQSLVPPLSEYHLLQEIANSLPSLYLRNWARHLHGLPNQVVPEVASQLIAAHLLDLGFSRQYLHQWLNERLYGADTVITMSELLEACAALAARPTTTYDVMIPMEARPLKTDCLPAEWRDASSVSAWFTHNGHDRIKQHGGLLFQIRARDPWDAVEQAIEMIDAVRSRFVLATRRKRHVRFFPDAWIGSVTGRFPLERRPRGVEVGSIQRTGRLFTVSPDSPVDAALELLAPLDSGPPAAAISGAWAAIEALLVRPDDKERGVAATQRLADLVACSLPRAELTTLAYKHASIASDELAADLSNAPTNRDKAVLMASALLANRPLGLNDVSDVLAAARLRSFLTKPLPALVSLSQLSEQAFRRVYRQRNLILHGGRNNAVALRATLRTASPIIGAGIDRIAHSWFVSQTPPLALAARAHHRLHLSDQDGAVSLVDMLE